MSAAPVLALEDADWQPLESRSAPGRANEPAAQPVMEAGDGVQPPPPVDDERLRHLQAHMRTSENPLMADAASIIDLILVLNEGASHEDPVQLRHLAAEEIRAFHRRVQRRSVALQTVRIASYGLCAALDEAVLTTGWGSESGWGMETLLWTFHRDSSGGENFFIHLANLALAPDAQVELVELLALLVDLGYQGRHRVAVNGAYELDGIRERLHEIIRSHRSNPHSPLLAPSQTAERPERPLRRAGLGLAACLVVALSFGYAQFYERAETVTAGAMERLDQLLEAHQAEPGRLP